MKSLKTMGKIGLSMFFALIMCFGLLQVNAYAADIEAGSETETGTPADTSSNDTVTNDTGNNTNTNVGGGEDTQQPSGGDTSTGGGDTQQPGGGDTQESGGGDTSGGGENTQQPGGDGDTQEPGGDGDTQEPGGDGDTQEPGTGDGDTQEPGTGDGDTQEPGDGDGNTQQPGGDDGDTQEPGGDDGDTQEPGDDDGDTQEPGDDDGEDTNPPADPTDPDDSDSSSSGSSSGGSTGGSSTGSSSGAGGDTSSAETSSSKQEFLDAIDSLLTDVNSGAYKGRGEELSAATEKINSILSTLSEEDQNSSAILDALKKLEGIDWNAVTAEELEEILEEAEGITTVQALQEAINNANGGTIFLGGDIKLEGTPITSVNKDFTLDMRGHILDGNNASAVLILNGGTVTIKDGTITGGITEEGGTGGGINAANATLTLNNVTVQDSQATYGGGICTSNVVLTLENSTVQGNEASYGGGIYTFTGGSLNVKNSQVKGNSAISGGGIYVDHGDVKIEDSAIAENTASSYGGGIYVNDSNVSIKGVYTPAADETDEADNGEVNEGDETANNETDEGDEAVSEETASPVGIYGNTAAYYGGGIYVNMASAANQLIIDSTEFEGNEANYGAAVYLYNSNANGAKFDITNSRILNNTAKGIGVLSVWGDAKAKFVEMTITGSEMGGNTGGIMEIGNAKSVTISDTNISNNSGEFVVTNYALDTAFLMENTTFSGNTSGYQKLMEIDVGGTFTVRDCKITENTGGQLYFKGYSDVNISGCNISDNVIQTGPLLYINSDSTAAKLTGGEITGNLGMQQTVYASAKTLTIEGTEITRNSAKQTGAVHIATGKLYVKGDTVIRDNTAQKYTGKVSLATGGILVSRGSNGFVMESGLLLNNTVEGRFADVGVEYNFGKSRAAELSLINPNTMVESETEMSWWDFIASEQLDSVYVTMTTQHMDLAVQPADGKKRVIALIGDVAYETVADAVAAAQNGDTIQIVVGEKDPFGTSFKTDTVAIDKSITIDMRGHKLMTDPNSSTYAPVFKVISNGVSSGALTLVGPGNISGNLEVDGGVLTLDNDTIEILGDIVVKGDGAANLSNLFRFSYDDGKIHFIDIANGSVSVDHAMNQPLNVHLGEGQHLTTGADFSTSLPIKLTLSTATYQKFENGDSSEKLDDLILIEGYALTDRNQVKFTTPFNNGLISVRAVDGNTVLRKAVYNNSKAIYLDGVNGDDNKNGKSASNAVRTFETAAKLATDGENDGTIFVVGKVTVTEAETWNQSVKLSRDPANSYRGSLVEVASNGNLTLGNNIVLDGGAEEYGLIANSDGSLVRVIGGELTITGNATLRDNICGLNSSIGSTGGAIYVTDGGGKYGTLKMEGGTIENNRAFHGGGVALIKGNFDFSGGKISGNVADNTYGPDKHAGGGGVFVAYNSTMNMSGDALIDGNRSGYGGGGISLGGTANSAFIFDGRTEHFRPTFNMNGGTITNNYAGNSGGGLFVQENCIATIDAGVISYNECGNSMFGGGGIYVNGHKSVTVWNYDGTPGKTYELTNGLLRLHNAAIYDNTGVIAGCPTSNSRIYLRNGAVIYDNLENAVADVYLSSKLITAGELINGYANIYLSALMLGGNAYAWKDATTGEALPLNFSQFGSYTTVPYDRVLMLNSGLSRSDITGIDPDTLAVQIFGNKAGANKGGAIGSNGDVVIGDAEDTMDIRVTKVWNDAGFENVRPKEIKVIVKRSSEKDTKPVEIGFIRITADDKGNLSLHSTSADGSQSVSSDIELSKDQNDKWMVIVKGLPKRDLLGNAYIYSIIEELDGLPYISTITEKDGLTADWAVMNPDDEQDSGKMNFTVSNIPVSADRKDPILVKIYQSVKTEEDDSVKMDAGYIEIGFDENGNWISERQQAMLPGMGIKLVQNKDGQWYVSVTNVPVRSEDGTEYVYSWDIDGDQSGVAKPDDTSGADNSDITIHSKWNHEDYLDVRPNSFEIKLAQVGKDGDTDVGAVKVVWNGEDWDLQFETGSKLNSDNVILQCLNGNWTAILKGIMEKDENGKFYSYKVTQTLVYEDGKETTYTTTVDPSTGTAGSDTSDIEIENKYDPSKVPDDPDDPDDPTPSRPSRDPDPDPDPEPEPEPEPEEPQIDIPEEDVPLADFPEEDIPVVDIPEEDVPLADIPEEDVPLADFPEEDIPPVEIPSEDVPTVEIPEEDVPMTDVPRTGDNSGLWTVMVLLSMLGLAALTMTRKKEEM